MKSILLSFASLLVTVSAFAMPAVGDHAVYNTTITQGGQTMTGTLEQAIISATGDMFEVQTTMNFNGQSQVQNEQKAAQDLVSDQLAAAVLANCAGYGGKLESATVPAGTFNTCALPTDGGTGTVWIATGVAFGVVKADMTENGNHTYAELQSFKNGN